MNRYSAPLIAVGLGLQFTDPRLNSPILALALVAMGAGFLMARKTPRPLWAWGLFAVMVGTTIAAIPAAIPAAIVRGHELPQTVILAVLTIPVACLFFIDDVKRVAWCLLPVVLVHAGMVYWDGWQGIGPRATGMTTSPNAAAGMLVIGTVALLTTPGRHRLLAIPLALAVAMTGARWASAVTLVVAFWVLLRTSSGKQPAVGAVALGLMLAFDLGGLRSAFMGGPLIADLGIRWPLHGAPPILPTGYMDPSGGVGSHFMTPHNVPLRMAYETGLLSAAAWLILSLGAMLHQRGQTGWWLLLAVVALSTAYYWTWVGPLGGIWALLIGSQLQFHRQPQEATSREPSSLPAGASTRAAGLI